MLLFNQGLGVGFRATMEHEVKAWVHRGGNSQESGDFLAIPTPCMNNKSHGRVLSPKPKTLILHVALESRTAACRL